MSAVLRVITWWKGKNECHHDDTHCPKKSTSWHCRGKKGMIAFYKYFFWNSGGRTAWHSYMYNCKGTVVWQTKPIEQGDDMSWSAEGEGWKDRSRNGCPYMSEDSIDLRISAMQKFVTCPLVEVFCFIFRLSRIVENLYWADIWTVGSPLSISFLGI